MFPSSSAIKFIGVAMCFLFFQVSGRAADGAFDATFASGGRTTFNLSASNLDGATGAGALQDGRLLIAGECGNNFPCLARLKTDGSFDTTFGPLQLGSARFDQFPNIPQYSTARDVIVLPDNRAVVAGCFGSNNAAIYMVRSDGTGLDTSVGNGNGYFSGTQGTAQFYDCAIRVRRQVDGKFLVLQEVKDNSYGQFMVVSRVAADLSGLDTTFGVNGITRIAFGLAGQSGNTDQPTSLEVQADGKIVVGGYGGHTQRVLEFARLLTSGQFDLSFGADGNGRFHYGITGIDLTASDISIDAAQRAVFSGAYYDGAYTQLVGRLTATGALDASFADGFVTFASAAGTSGTQRVTRVVTTADSIIALGFIPRTNGDTDDYFQVTRLNLAGTKVASFGGGGSTYASFASADTMDTPRALLLTTRGLVVAGSSINGSLQFGVARLQYEHIFESGFE
jgi:uncharacterized delta-60 repeat protein